MIVRVGVAVAVNIFVVSYNSQTPFNTDTDGAIENVRISGVRAVARFFVKVGGDIARVEGTNLVGGLGVSSPRNFSNLEAPKCFFQHLS